MTDWELVGCDNAKARERRAAQPRWRRVIRSHAEAAMVAAAWIVAGLLVWMVLRSQ